MEQMCSIRIDCSICGWWLGYCFSDAVTDVQTGFTRLQSGYVSHRKSSARVRAYGAPVHHSTNILSTAPASIINAIHGAEEDIRWWRDACTGDARVIFRRIRSWPCMPTGISSHGVGSYKLMILEMYYGAVRLVTATFGQRWNRPAEKNNL
jgi:hypothetical protein